MKRFSFLGLVLVAASAVTAAILPSKAKSDSAARAVGQLVLSSDGGGQTCINAGSAVDCTYTRTGVGAASGSNEITGGTNTGNSGAGTTIHS